MDKIDVIPLGLTPADIGSIVAGLAAFAALLWIIGTSIKRYLDRPNLKIELDPQWKSKLMKYVGTEIVGKVSGLFVRNDGKILARRCIATLKVLEKPIEAKNLDNEHNLHWADVDYSLKTNEPETIDIGSEPRRFDVAFTPKHEFKIDEELPANAGPTSPTPPPPLISEKFQETPSKGSWIAIPIALSVPSEANQAYLPPGNYKVEISVKCENGLGDTKIFNIKSPENWNELDIELSNKEA